MMLLNYFTFLSYSANKEYNSRIQNQLKDSNEDERKFTAILDQQRQETQAMVTSDIRRRF